MNRVIRHGLGLLLFVGLCHGIVGNNPQEAPINLVEVTHIDSQGVLVARSPVGGEAVSLNREESARENETIQEAASVQDTRISPIFSTPDENPPMIRSFLFDGKEPTSGDAISSQPLLKMDVFALNLVSTWSFTVLDSENTVVAEKLANHGSSTQSATLIWQPETSLPEGTYEVIARVQDQAGNTTTASVTSLMVFAGFQVQGFICGPNPYNPNRDRFTVEYELTQPAEVQIFVMNIDGEQQWQYHALPNDPNGGSVGFHQIPWDGRSRYGQILSNGPYQVIVSSHHGGQRKILKQKLLVLK